LLSRKAEGIDPVKPWQPFNFKEGAKFYQIIWIDNPQEFIKILPFFITIIL